LITPNDVVIKKCFNNQIHLLTPEMHPLTPDMMENCLEVIIYHYSYRKLTKHLF